MQRLWRWIAGLIGLAALLLALAIGAFRLAIDLLPGYQQRIVDRVHEATGLTLEFDSIYARIGRYGPEIVFRGARVLPDSGDEPLVTADAGRVSLSIPRSIWYRRLEVARVAFVRPRLNFVITPDGRIRLVGQSALQQPGCRARADDARSLAARPLRRHRRRARRPRPARAAGSFPVDRRRPRDGAQRRRHHARRPRRAAGSPGLLHRRRSRASGDLADSAARSTGAPAWMRANSTSSSGRRCCRTVSACPTAGHGSIRVSARGAGRDVTSLRLQPDLEDLRPAGSGQVFSRIAGDIRLQRDATTVSIEATGLELSRRRRALAADQPRGAR